MSFSAIEVPLLCFNGGRSRKKPREQPFELRNLLKLLHVVSGFPPFYEAIMFTEAGHVRTTAKMVFIVKNTRARAC